MYNAEHACCGLTITDTRVTALSLFISNPPAGTLVETAMGRRLLSGYYYYYFNTICMMLNTPGAS